MSKRYNEDLRSPLCSLLAAPHVCYNGQRVLQASDRHSRIVLPAFWP
jgi:hypothetical protein